MAYQQGQCHCFLLSSLPLQAGRQAGPRKRACTVSETGRTLTSGFKNPTGPLAAPRHCTLLEAQLPAGHLGAHHGPAIVADGAPLPPVVHLQAALVAAPPTCQSEGPICDRKETQKLSQMSLEKGQNRDFLSWELSPCWGLSLSWLLVKLTSGRLPAA